MVSAECSRSPFWISRIWGFVSPAVSKRSEFLSSPSRVFRSMYLAPFEPAMPSRIKGADAKAVLGERLIISVSSPPFPNRFTSFMSSLREWKSFCAKGNIASCPDSWAVSAASLAVRLAPPARNLLVNSFVVGIFPKRIFP